MLDCLSGYLWLGAKLGSSGKNSSYATAYNFGPALSRNKTVRAVVEEFLKYWPGKWVDFADTNGCPEATLLPLSIRKAAGELDWKPTWRFYEAVKHTAAWYRRRKIRGEIGLRKFSLSQIASFTRAARKQMQPWALPGSDFL